MHAQQSFPLIFTMSYVSLINNKVQNVLKCEHLAWKYIHMYLRKWFRSVEREGEIQNG